MLLEARVESFSKATATSGLVVFQRQLNSEAMLRDRLVNISALSDLMKTKLKAAREVADTC
jgi:hypothetical protein